MNTDINIVGLGIVNIDQITIEAADAMKNSNEILFIEAGIGIEDYLSRYCKKVTNLITLYTENTDRLNTYYLMAAKVIEAALTNPPICFALYGHPTTFSYPPFLIDKIAKILNLKVKIFPGISSMDCIFTELMIDPGQRGLQIYEATDLLLRKRPLQIDVPALIWQIGALETALFSVDDSNSKRFLRFKNYMLSFYPEDHVVTAIYISNIFLMKSETLHFKISEICEYSEKLHSGHTLYVPPVFERKIMNKELVNQLLDIDHLKSITKKNRNI